MGLRLLEDGLKSLVWNKEDEIMSVIVKMLEETFGIKFEILKRKKGKSTLITDIKTIFCYNCRSFGIRVESISKRLKRDHSTVSYHIDKYDGLYKYNKDFRELADRFNNKLKEIQDETNE